MIKLYLIAFTATGIINSVEIETYETMDLCLNDIEHVARLEKKVLRDLNNEYNIQKEPRFIAAECVTIK